MVQNVCMRTADFNINQKDIDVLVAIRQVARPLIVGGSVRDAILGIPCKDIDIEIHELDNISTLVDVLAKFGKVDEVGKAFGVFKVRGLDISLPRRDSKTGEGHTGFSITVDTSMTLKEAASRRDFTINAMMFDPFTEELIDLFGGQEDIHASVLRHTSEAFGEDPLRVLRGVQFAARFGMYLDRNTIEICKTLADEFETISKERIWTEFEKILTKSTALPLALKALRDTEWIRFFPGLKSVAGDRTQNVIRLGEIEKTLASLMIEAQAPLGIGAPITLEKKAMKLVQAHRHSGRLLNRLSLTKIARDLQPFTLAELLQVRPDVEVLKLAKKYGILHSVPEPFITGDDLIAAGLTPGPKFKPILAYMLDRQDAGLVFSREEALFDLTSLGLA